MSSNKKKTANKTAVPESKPKVLSRLDEKSKLRLQNGVFISLMVAAFFFALWKTHYGYRDYDETFFLAIPHRLSLGDVMFKHEWNLAQMSGFLLLPFVKLYTLITGGTEGIILAARIYYTVLHTAVASYVYYRLRKYGYIALFGCLLFFLFSPFDIMAYSYNSMALDLLVLSGVTMATTSYEKKTPLILSGLAFAGAVLCSPYMLFVFVTYVVCVGIHHLLKKLGRLPNVVLRSELFSIKTALWFTVGAASLAVVFLIWLLPRVSIGEIFESVSRMMSYSRLKGMTFGGRVNSYFTSIYNMNTYFPIVLGVYGAMLIGMIIDRNRRRRAALYLIISAACTIYSLSLMLEKSEDVYFNCIMIPMFFIGLTSYILCKEKPKTIFASVFCLGILYSFFAFLGSDQGIHIISVAFVIVNFAGYIFLAQLIKEMVGKFDSSRLYKGTLIAASVVLVAALGIQFGVQFHNKRTHCFWEFGIDTLDTEFTQGPAKGIYSADYTVAKYNEIYNDIQSYKNMKSDNMLVLYSNPWVMMALHDMKYSGYSAWIGDDRYTSASEVSQRLLDYWEVNPDKMPKYVYIVKGTEWDKNTLFGPFVGKGYTYSENNISYKMERTGVQ